MNVIYEYMASPIWREANNEFENAKKQRDHSEEKWCCGTEVQAAIQKRRGALRNDKGENFRNM